MAHIQALEFGPQNTVEMKAAAVDLDTLTISVLTKEELRKQSAKIQKDVVHEQEKRQKAESKTALDTVRGPFKKEENKDDKFLVGHLPISANTKCRCHRLLQLQSG